MKINLFATLGGSLCTLTYEYLIPAGKGVRKNLLHEACFIGTVTVYRRGESYQKGKEAWWDPGHEVVVVFTCQEI